MAQYVIKNFKNDNNNIHISYYQKIFSSQEKSIYSYYSPLIGVTFFSSSGAPISMYTVRHPTLAQHGSQPSRDLYVLNTEIIT